MNGVTNVRNNVIVTQTLGLSNPKSSIIKLQLIVEDYYCAKFQIIPISGFRSIAPTHPHTSWQSDRYIRAAVLTSRARIIKRYTFCRDTLVFV